MKANIGYKKVEVKSGPKTMAYFTGGVHGERESGHYYFWTAVTKSGKARRVWGRSRIYLPPGDRFKRMFREQYSAKHKSVRDSYARIVLWLDRVSYIRPSTKKEVELWAQSHGGDAIFIRWFRADRKKYELQWRLEVSPA